MQRNSAIEFFGHFGPIGRKAIYSHFESVSGWRCLECFLYTFTLSLRTVFFEILDTLRQ